MLIAYPSSNTALSSARIIPYVPVMKYHNHNGTPSVVNLLTYSFMNKHIVILITLYIISCKYA